MILDEDNVLESVDQEINIESLTDDNHKKPLKNKDSKANFLIVQCVDDRLIEILKDKKSSFEMWETLKEKCEEKVLPAQ